MAPSIVRKWKEIKKSGSFHRKIKKNYLRIFKEQAVKNPSPTSPVPLTFTASSNQSEQIVELEMIEKESEEGSTLCTIEAGNEGVDEEYKVNNETDEASDYSEDEDDKNEMFLQNLREWSVSMNITHVALKKLFKIMNQRFPRILPQDPRIFLRTAINITLHQLNNGQYWHYGLAQCLNVYFYDLNKDLKISLNINIDGLPVYKSSKEECWPILFNIYEIEDFKPMVIGIYSGKGKPNDISSFLNQFVQEAKLIMQDGLYINGYKITVQIRCFICDSPARAFVKGVANFNSHHGCLKCTTVGEYSYVSNTNYFPYYNNCLKRTDQGFRAKEYGLHHKSDSPLLELPIDMVECFPVGDSLHLLHLGIMKKCLIGWRDGKFGNYNTKWAMRDITEISEFLVKCKLPQEIHRSVRGLDCLAFWKALEFRTFLHYISIIILKDYLPSHAYEHFLTLFCAVTICSSQMYTKFLNLAQILLEHYIEIFGDIYGEDFISSNVHNLMHLVEEVKKFGILSTFTTYPFENKLFQIKRLLRSGRLPLSQIAKRISESSQILHKKNTFAETKSVDLKNNKLILKDYILKSDEVNKWFLNNKNEIVALKEISNENGLIVLYGTSLKNTHDFFQTPIKSSHLNIFVSDYREINEVTSYSVDQIKCKLVGIKYNDKMVFIPLLHTLN